MAKLAMFTPTPADRKNLSANLLAKKTSKAGNDYFQLEMAQEIKRETNTQSLLAFFNTGDSRFSQAKARKFWMMVSPEFITTHLGITLEQLEKLNIDESIELNIEDFRPADKLLSIQITERSESQINDLIAKSKGKTKLNYEYMIENIERRCKQIPDVDKIFVSTDGERVVQEITLVEGDPTHTYVDGEFLLNEEVTFETQTVAEPTRQPELNPFNAIK